METKHIFHMDELFTANASGNKLNGTSGIGTIGQSHGAPDNQCPVDEDHKAGDAVLTLPDGKRGISVSHGSEAGVGRQGGLRDIKRRIQSIEMINYV